MDLKSIQDYKEEIISWESALSLKKEGFNKKVKRRKSKKNAAQLSKINKELATIQQFRNEWEEKEKSQKLLDDISRLLSLDTCLMVNTANGYKQTAELEIIEQHIDKENTSSLRLPLVQINESGQKWVKRKTDDNQKIYCIEQDIKYYIQGINGLVILDSLPEGYVYDKKHYALVKSIKNEDKKYTKHLKLKASEGIIIPLDYEIIDCE